MYSILEIYDAGDEFDDRYTIYFRGPGCVEPDGVMFLSMNSLGMYYHGNAWPEAEIENGSITLSFDDLPEPCQETTVAALRELNAGVE